MDGRAKGFGFVEMSTEEEAAKAMEKYDQSSFKERTIVVNEAKPQINRSFSKDRKRHNYDRKPKGDLNYKLKRLRKRFR